MHCGLADFILFCSVLLQSFMSLGEKKKKSWEEKPSIDQKNYDDLKSLAYFIKRPPIYSSNSPPPIPSPPIPPPPINYNPSPPPPPIRSHVPAKQTPPPPPKRSDQPKVMLLYFSV